MFKQTNELPQCILDDMEMKMDYTTRDNVFHASEVAYTCMYKAYMDRLEGKEFDDTGKYNIYRGRLFDKHLTKLFDENELRVQHRIKNSPFVIRGRIDCLDYESNTIYEIKTVQSIKFVRAPFKHHIPQGIFYLTNYDPLATLKFMYFSMDGYKVFEYEDSLETADAIMKEMEERAITLGTAIKKEEPPTPTKGGECRYCKYKEQGRCPIVRTRKKK
jgi:hypothetical protein